MASPFWKGSGIVRAPSLLERGLPRGPLVDNHWRESSVMFGLIKRTQYLAFSAAAGKFNARILRGPGEQTSLIDTVSASRVGYSIVASLHAGVAGGGLEFFGNGGGSLVSRHGLAVVLQFGIHEPWLRLQKAG